jgi:hypothetical protein
MRLLVKMRLLLVGEVQLIEGIPETAAIKMLIYKL